MEKAYREQFDSVHMKRMENVDLVLASESQKRPHEADFVDEKKPGFSRDDVQKDINFADKKEKEFNQKRIENNQEDVKKVGEALEVIIIDKGEKMGWFGETARLSRTSKFDDLFNGIDGIVEFEEASNPRGIALEIDASMTHNPEILKAKIERNINKITGKGKPVEVKYFQSKITGKKERLTFIVPVVVGLEWKNSHQLIGQLAEIEKLMKSGKSDELERKTEEIKKHPAQIVFFKEILIQLKKYSQELEKEISAITKKDDNPFNKLALEMKVGYQKEVEKISNIIKRLVQNKKDIDTGELENDRTYETIKKLCENS